MVLDIAAHSTQFSRGTTLTAGTSLAPQGTAVGLSTSMSCIHPSQFTTVAAGEPCSASHGHHRSPTPQPSPTMVPSGGRGVPPCLPPGTAALTRLHGEEEEEEGSGAAPAAAGPGARQPGHGFASASAGARHGIGTRWALM